MASNWQGVNWLELHHVVILSAPTSKKALAIDFSPLNQASPSTLLNLVLSRKVPGEIRTRLLRSEATHRTCGLLKLFNSSLSAESEIFSLKEQWSCISMPDMSWKAKLIEKLHPTPEIELADDDDDLLEIKSIIDDVKTKWSHDMHLYSHNCQHFSRYVVQLLKNYECCQVWSTQRHPHHTMIQKAFMCGVHTCILCALIFDLVDFPPTAKDAGCHL